MIKATRNQLANVANPYQGRAQKVLCVCSAGLLRSPTAASVLHQEFGFNTRSCGHSQEYALIPISEALIDWADQVVFVNQENFDALSNEAKDLLSYRIVTILDIPDQYNYNDPALRAIIKEQYLDQCVQCPT